MYVGQKNCPIGIATVQQGLDTTDHCFPPLPVNARNIRGQKQEWTTKIVTDGVIINDTAEQPDNHQMTISSSLLPLKANFTFHFSTTVTHSPAW
jgi:hypothetical protein